MLYTSGTYRDVILRLGKERRFSHVRRRGGGLQPRERARLRSGVCGLELRRHGRVERSTEHTRRFRGRGDVGGPRARSIEQAHREQRSIEGAASFCARSGGLNGAGQSICGRNVEVGTQLLERRRREGGRCLLVYGG
jgi:hypothetical protein